MSANLTIASHGLPSVLTCHALEISVIVWFVKPFPTIIPVLGFGMPLCTPTTSPFMYRGLASRPTPGEVASTMHLGGFGARFSLSWAEKCVNATRCLSPRSQERLGFLTRMQAVMNSLAYDDGEERAEVCLQLMTQQHGKVEVKAQINKDVTSDERIGKFVVVLKVSAWRRVRSRKAFSAMLCNLPSPSYACAP
eukprot:3754605-Amphidinium_carterae.1